MTRLNYLYKFKVVQIFNLKVSSKKFKLFYFSEEYSQKNSTKVVQKHPKVSQNLNLN
jgi:hypothetical protein